MEVVPAGCGATEGRRDLLLTCGREGVSGAGSSPRENAPSAFVLLVGLRPAMVPAEAVDVRQQTCTYVIPEGEGASAKGSAPSRTFPTVVQRVGNFPMKRVSRPPARRRPGVKVRDKVHLSHGFAVTPAMRDAVGSASGPVTSVTIVTRESARPGHSLATEPLSDKRSYT